MESGVLGSIVVLAAIFLALHAVSGPKSTEGRTKQSEGRRRWCTTCQATRGRRVMWCPACGSGTTVED